MYELVTVWQLLLEKNKDLPSHFVAYLEYYYLVQAASWGVTPVQSHGQYEYYGRKRGRLLCSLCYDIRWPCHKTSIPMSCFHLTKCDSRKHDFKNWRRVVKAPRVRGISYQSILSRVRRMSPSHGKESD
jgi:hypothetical protein